MEILHSETKEGFEAAIKEMGECEITGQILMMNGALNAVQYLLKWGPTKANAEDMRASLEECITLIEAVAAERGYAIEFERHYSQGV